MTSRVGRRLLAVALVLASAREAGAVEREHQLGVDLGASILAIANSNADLGPAFGIHYGYGITDQFNLLAELQYSIVAFSAPARAAMGDTTHPSQMWNADVGVTYILDVLRWVPYFGALAGGYMLSGGDLLG